jgi:RsiW-degrading membrane proteinase PrsW (M82 family)
MSHDPGSPPVASFDISNLPPDVVGSGISTAAAIALLLFTDVGGIGLLLIAAVGAPITVLLLARAVAVPVGEQKSLVPSVLIGATLVPLLVLLLSSTVFAVAFVFVEPFAELTRGLLEDLRADPELLGIFASPWAFLFLLEMAVVAPFAEETLKPLGALLRRPRSARDAFLFGAAAGAGFAAIENILYASGWFWSFDGWLPISLMRLSGCALHLLGAGLVSLGWYQWRHEGRGFGQLAKRYALAVGIHALWNGAIAVTVILYGERASVGQSLAGSSLAWGIALMLFLSAYGALLLAGLLSLAGSVREGADPDRLLGVVDFGAPATVGAWAMISSAIVLPATILILVFPGFLAI